MRVFLTLGMLLLLTGCGPRDCIGGFRNPFQTGPGSNPQYRAPNTDPGGQGAASGGAEAASAPHASEGPPLTMGAANPPMPKQAHPDASKTHPAPTSLASRSVSTPTRPKLYTGEAKYDADGGDDRPYADDVDDGDYVRPRVAGRDRVREDDRPRRPDYVTRREERREPKYRADRGYHGDRGMYGDAPRLHRETGRRADERPGRRALASGRDDRRVNRHGGRERYDAPHGMSADEGRRNRRHVNVYDGPEMKSADTRRHGGAEGRRGRREHATGGEERRGDRRGERRDRRRGHDDMG